MRPTVHGILLVLVVLVSMRGAARGEQPATEKTPAILVVRLPADATLRIGGVLCKQSGAVREFETPPLVRGKTFAYPIEAVWTDKGKAVTREAKALVRGGEKTELNLLTLPMPDKKLAPQPRTELEKPKNEKKALSEKKASSETRVTPIGAKKTEPEKTPPFEKQPTAEKKRPPEKKATPLPEKKSTPEKKPELIKKIEPPKNSELAKKTEPEKKPEVVKKAEPEKKPEPSERTDLAKKTEPEKKKPILSEPKNVIQQEKAKPKVAVPVVVQKPLPPSAPSRPALQLLMPEILTLQPGVTKLLPIRVIRTDFEGPVTVKWERLPSGVQINEVTIAPGKNKVYVEASATREASGQEVEVNVVGLAARVRQANSLKVKIAK